MGREREKREEPYLKPGRLLDLLAAIQKMALFEHYRRPPEKWAYLISGDKAKADYWRAIFNDHPEFFRPSTRRPGDYSLVWRRAGTRFHRKRGQTIDGPEAELLSEEEREEFVSRSPVPEAQIKTLLDTAINLHQKAIDAQRDRRWWVAPVIATVAVIGSFTGAILGALVKG